MSLGANGRSYGSSSNSRKYESDTIAAYVSGTGCGKCVGISQPRSLLGEMGKVNEEMPNLKRIEIRKKRKGKA